MYFKDLHGDTTSVKIVCVIKEAINILTEKYTSWAAFDSSTSV